MTTHTTLDLVVRVSIHQLTTWWLPSLAVMNKAAIHADIQGFKFIQVKHVPFFKENARLSSKAAISAYPPATNVSVGGFFST